MYIVDLSSPRGSNVGAGAAEAEVVAISLGIHDVPEGQDAAAGPGVIVSTALGLACMGGVATGSLSVTVGAHVVDKTAAVGCVSVEVGTAVALSVGAAEELTLVVAVAIALGAAVAIPEGALTLPPMAFETPSQTCGPEIG
jgi:hypothetical protein